jgi:uncharacterized protein (TIRG00374 family)
MTKSNLGRFGLGVGLAVIFVWLILRKINISDVSNALGASNGRWVCAAVLAFAVGYSSRIERWRIMLRRDNANLSWWDCAGPLMASVAANNILPFRAGDVIRSFAFNQKLGISSGVSITTLLVERLLDLLMLLTLLGLSLVSFGMNIGGFVGFGSAALIAGALVLLAVLLFPRRFLPLSLIVVEPIGRVAPAFARKLHDEIHKSIATLEHAGRGSTMLKLVFWSLVTWLAEGLVFWFAALALPALSYPLASWLALSMGTLATLIPGTPGFVGTFDYFTVLAMTELGNAASAATAYAILVHILLWVPATLTGGLYLLSHPVRYRKRAF